MVNESFSESKEAACLLLRARNTFQFCRRYLSTNYGFDAFQLALNRELRIGARLLYIDRTSRQVLCSFWMVVETIGEAWQLGWRITARCTWAGAMG